MSNSNKLTLLLRKTGDKLYDLIDAYNNDVLYVFDLKDVKAQYYEVLKGYENHPHLFDVADFARNYSFSYYQKNGLLDHQKELLKMEREVFEYVLKLQKKNK